MNKLKSYAASRRGRDTLLSFGIVIAAFIIVQALIAGGMISSQIKGLLVPICAYVVMAVSLNLTVGISGELSLGHAGFMSVGAFSGIVMAMWLSKGMGVANETLCLLRRSGRRRGRGHRYSGAAPARRLSGNRHAGVR